jgi:hypothetical protein
VITEVWIAPPMPAMIGYSYTMSDGQVGDWEQMRIETRDVIHGDFVAMPRGGDPVRFARLPVIGVSDSSSFRGHLVFENAAHDFPQRIVYRGYTDRLIATLSRADGSSEITINYHRIDCEAALEP